MSAFIVDDIHIHSIVNFASSNGFLFEEREPVKGNESKVGQMLVNSNYESVNARYEKNTVAPAYVFDKRLAKVLKPVQFVKLLHGLDYQSCEHADWGTSTSYATLRNWSWDADRLYEGYGIAEWAL